MAQEPIIGIDLGTTFSVIGTLDVDGKPQTILNLEGDLTTPSAVYFHPDEIVVGKEAVKVAPFEPGLIARFVKRDVGKTTYSKSIKGIRLPPEVIQALILSKLRDDAKHKVGDFSKCVITVPAFFNEPRRKATMDAGRIAGLEVLDIINEPTAAAIAYGVQQGFLAASGEAASQELVLVYDLGGGTFDVTLMEIEGLRYTALSTAGDVHLGGIDFDRRLVDHLAEQFQTEHNLDPREDERGLQSLIQEAEDAKRSLTSRGEVMVHLAHGGHRSRVKVTREQFDSLTSDLLQRTVFTANKVLREGKRTWSDVTRILLVGGSTRMPMVQEAIEKESGITVDRSLSPDEAVAHGAAIYAGFLAEGSSDKRPEFVVDNVNSHDLGVLAFERKTGMQRRQTLIPRNTKLPATGKGGFVTRHDNQTNVVVNVVEGGDASGKNATHIGKCTVSGLPDGLPAKSKVVVRFQYASNGRLEISASVPEINCEATMTIERAAGLSDEEIASWKEKLETGLSVEPVNLEENAITLDESSAIDVDETETSADQSGLFDDLEGEVDEELIDDEGEELLARDNQAESASDTRIGIASTSKKSAEPKKAPAAQTSIDELAPKATPVKATPVKAATKATPIAKPTPVIAPKQATLVVETPKEPAAKDDDLDDFLKGLK
ncbi:MAG: molecular chaperone DnaK [Pirellulaceae bacterium]|jgi:molecular chaperone DnaK